MSKNIEAETILFVVPSFKVGGVETYLLNLIRRLSERGYRIKVLLLSGKVDQGMIDELSGYSDVYDILDYTPLKCIPDKLKSASNYMLNVLMPLLSKPICRDFVDVTHVHAVCSFSLVFSYKLKGVLRGGYKISVGVYHSKEFLWGAPWFREYQKKCFTLLPRENIWMGSEYVAEMYSNYYKDETFRHATQFPLGIDLEKFSKCSYGLTSRKIVMIGRLVTFKSYQEALIKAFSLSGLKDRGYSLHYYGDGENANQLKRLSTELDVGVVFHGGVAYESLPQILSGSCLFVGGGLSIIEASAIGVPSIIGIESETELEGYGFFADLKGSAYNSKFFRLKRSNLVADVQSIANMGEEGLLALSKRHRQKAEEFSLDVCVNKFERYICDLSMQGRADSSIGYYMGVLAWAVANQIGLRNDLRNRLI